MTQEELIELAQECGDDKEARAALSTALQEVLAECDALLPLADENKRLSNLLHIARAERDALAKVVLERMKVETK